MKCCFLEVYNEIIRDLLVDGLAIRKPGTRDTIDLLEESLRSLPVLERPGQVVEVRHMPRLVTLGKRSLRRIRDPPRSLEAVVARNVRKRPFTRRVLPGQATARRPKLLPSLGRDRAAEHDMIAHASARS